uniref:Uncharacterized protein n=1 Tax=Pseudo-nitzschia australis TaxID=44445 RepID=A0A6U9VZJ5_9STRA|mmetsp:Transcript_17313/g.37946  ORF Transcript_17313/g.37946 Transcript_17313/m.37946 type:complete len:255 (-) Transcript_17313:1694-2458(-)
MMMPLVDEESALMCPTSPIADGLEDRANHLPNHSTNGQQQQQPQTQMMANHIPATRGNGNRHPSEIKKQAPPKPKLLHPILHSVPLHFRFGLNGFLSNVLFMVAYNEAVVQFEHKAASSTIYAAVYLIFIPVSHAIISLLVFGWPERYVRSLMSNAPVGLTAIVLGAALTTYCEEIEFNGWVAEAVTEYWGLIGYKADTAVTTTDGITTGPDEASRGGGEFYSSLFVLIVTGIWTFVLSVMVNAPPESLEKKEV